MAAPVQLAPNVVRPKSRTVSATRSPFPGAPRMFSFGTNMSLNASRPVAVPRMLNFSIRVSSTSKPGMSGVTRNAVISFFLSLPAPGVLAMTVRTCAMPPFVM